MTTKKTGFENGSNGTTITTSGGNPDAFTEVVLVGTGTAKYSTTRAAHGSVSALIDAPASGDKVTIGWLSGFGSSTLSDSICMYWAAYPSGATDIAAIRNATANAAKIQLWNDGKLRVVDAAGTIIKTFASAIGTGAWVRLEYGATKGTTTSNGRIQCAYYTKDGTTATDSYDSGATVDAGTTDLTVAHRGWLSGSSTGQYWLDSYQAQDAAIPLGVWNTDLVFEIDDTVGIADDGQTMSYDWLFEVDDTVGVSDSIERVGPAGDAVLGEDVARVGSAVVGASAGWFYGLQERAGSKTAGDTSGVAGRPKLRSTKVGKSGGRAPAFGVEGVMPDGTAVLFTPASYGDGYCLYSSSVRSYLSTGYTVICAFQWSSGDLVELVQIGDSPGAQVRIFAADSAVVAEITSASGTMTRAIKAVTTNDGEPHCLVFTVTGNAARLYIDLDPQAATAVPQGMGYVYGLTIGYPAHAPVHIAWVGYASRTVDAEGAGLLAGLALGDSEPSDARIGRIVRWVTGQPGRIEPGLSEVAYQSTKGQQALDVINEANYVEGGVFFTTGAGEFVQHARSHRYNAPVVAVIDADVVPISPSDLRPVVDTARLVNVVTATRPTGASYTARNKSSIAKYGEVTKDMQIVAASDDQLESAAGWYVKRYGSIRPHIPSITLDLLPLDAATANMLLDLEIGDRIQVVNLPSQTPGGSTIDLFIEGVEESVSVAQWSLRFATSPGSTNPASRIESARVGSAVVAY